MKVSFKAHSVTNTIHVAYIEGVPKAYIDLENNLVVINILGAWRDVQYDSETEFKEIYKDLAKILVEVYE